MTWSAFYLTCFLVGFGMSALSLLSGSVHLHIPHLHFDHGIHLGHMHGHGAEIEPRRAVLPAVPVPQMNAVIEVQVGQMQVYAAGQERQGAHAEPHEKTDEIKTGPGHERLLGLGAGVEGGAFKTSINRSASPGFSKIVPKRIRHIRESSCLAAANSA